MNTTLRSILVLTLPALAAILLTGCNSSIQPLKPLQRVDMWIPDDGSPAIQLTKPRPVPPPRPAVARAPLVAATTEPDTQPADIRPIDITTQSPATQTADTQTATTEPAEPAATQEAEVPTNLPPGKRVTRIIDPNQTERFIYKASYDRLWAHAQFVVNQLGFPIERRDYRLGVIQTRPLPSTQFWEFWKAQQTDGNAAMENTVNSQRRSIRLTITTVPGKPDFYQVGIQVLVEREVNEGETLAGPLFVEGSGFGRNVIALRSDYATLGALPSKWIKVGHDPKLERKLMDRLLKGM
jgi:uncharacterized lipoprotein